jgi:glycosyltransferase involved in cell wall biosynthesis
MSGFGLDNCRGAGFEQALYAPHGIDTGVFAPPADREELRASLALPDDRFIIGINAANRDSTRKAFPEQFKAFAVFHDRHPDSLLMVHSVAQGPAGLDLIQLADDLGIAEAVVINEPYAQITGIMDSRVMADWYGCLDVLSNCSYGEGFGIPLIEAQACGTPVIVTACSAMAELSGEGWQVVGQPFWNPTHRAWWTRPDIDKIVRAYERAYAERDSPKAERRRQRSREFAAAYDIDRVAEEYWEPLLKTLEGM